MQCAYLSPLSSFSSEERNFTIRNCREFFKTLCSTENILLSIHPKCKTDVHIPDSLYQTIQKMREINMHLIRRVTLVNLSFICRRIENVRKKKHRSMSQKRKPCIRERDTHDSSI